MLTALCPCAQYKRRDVRAIDSVRPRPRLEDENAESSGAELEMFFTRPQQLLEEFTQLEESNLFLIQNCQVLERMCRAWLPTVWHDSVMMAGVYLSGFGAST